MSNIAASASASRVPDEFREYEGDRQFATTLARGLELLRCFTPNRPVLGNKELSQQLGLPPSTISRLAYTLTRMGYLSPTEYFGKYQLGSAVLSLGYPLLTQFTVRRQARPLMLKLAQATGGSVSIGIRDRLTIVYIEAIRAHKQREYPLDIGTSHSLLGTAIGRAFLMGCRPAERAALLNQLRIRKPQEWERHEAAVKDNMARFPVLGCCTAMGDVYSDVRAVAVPLGSIDRGEVAALNCSFQGRAVDEAWLLEDVRPQLQALARQLV